MKFGKELASQMVPEWHEKYVNYNELKSILKKIHKKNQISFNKNNNYNNKNTSPSSLHYPASDEQSSHLNSSLHRVFSGLIVTRSKSSSIASDIETPVGDDDVIVDHELVSVTISDDNDDDDDEALYFEKLDEEFGKVNEFYVAKVGEVMDEAVLLEKQMHALIAFRIRVMKSTLGEDVSTSVSMLKSAHELSKMISGRRDSADMIEEGTVEEEDDESIDNKDESIDNKEQNTNNFPECPMQLLDRITVNIHTAGTPLQTVKKLLNVPKQTEFRFTKENLKKAEEQLKGAFVVFHHKLRHLKSYIFLNMLAFSKIMKKYDKITSKKASKSYMKIVENAFLGYSNEVEKLIVRVEDTFIKHFANSNRRQGMNMLRPNPKREKHRITFSFGFFAGCAVTLVLALGLIIHARNILENKNGSQYMNTMFPLYSLFGFVCLHMIMYAGNIYFWRRYKVNYPFVLNLNHERGLGYRDVLYLSFALAVLALVCVISNLDMDMDPKTHDYKTFTELLPLLVVVVIMCILLCPLNILYRSSRYFFLSCVLRCILAPLYTVTLADCIMADQITSQIQAFRSIKFYICYYGWGDFKHREDTCNANDAYNTFNFIIAGIPFAIRLFQNVRLMCQTDNKLWGYNALKYFTTIVAVCTRTAYSVKDGLKWKIIAWVCSAVAGIFCTYWDIVIDWGLLQRNSTNRWLRDKLVIPHKSVYFGVIILNIVLRFAWLETVLNFRVSSLHTEALITIVASLEIIRRGIWNFFRLENEHLNNVSKFRAFKSVPLPFNYDDEDDDDKED